MKNNNLQNNFYNPENDSIKKIIEDLLSVHESIFEITDFSKGTIPSSLSDYKTLIKEFSIPEIGIRKDKQIKMIANLYKGVPRWNSPKTMYNVAPPPLLQTVISKFFNALYNPNLVLDVASGDSTLTEQKVIKAISEYIDWDWEVSGGVFTFGGKATTMYGIKLGIKKCSPESSDYGTKDDLVIISTKSGHPSHISDAEWLGIGSKNVFRIDVDKEGMIDLIELGKTMRILIEKGKKIASIIITGGSTNNMTVDPISEVIDLRDRLVAEYKMNYVPHVHLDAVVGFFWIFFKNYDFIKNKLSISPKVLIKIQKIIFNLKYINMVDSFGIDFHKMGFCPYISSLFMVKNKKPFMGWKENFVKYGQNSPFTYTIENSRPADGPNSAYIALNVLGELGFQEIIVHCMEIAEDLKNKIIESNDFEIINLESLGSSIIFAPIIPSSVNLLNINEEYDLRSQYTLYFYEKIKQTGNLYFIDKIPSNSTGGGKIFFSCLKVYIMSPYSNEKNNTKFIEFMKKIKLIIDEEFFSVIHKKEDNNFDHPLK